MSVNRRRRRGGRREGHLLRPLRRPRGVRRRAPRALLRAASARLVAAATEELPAGRERLLQRRPRLPRRLPRRSRRQGAAAGGARAGRALAAPSPARSCSRRSSAPSFKAIGWGDARVAARLFVRMTSEGALLELEAGRRLPAVRRSLARFLGADVDGCRFLASWPNAGATPVALTQGQAEHRRRRASWRPSSRSRLPRQNGTAPASPSRTRRRAR